MATINGTANKNVITGTALLDTIYGLGGDDTVNAGAGNDTIYGGIGNDILRGEGGDDVISGGDGNDSLNGGVGSDTLDGGLGVDTAYFTSATEGGTISLAEGTAEFAVDGNDTLAGIENISGSNFVDIIYGDDNNNTLAGLAGADEIHGGGGSDRLTGGLGADVLDGGDGTDTVVYSAATVAATVNLLIGSGGGAAAGDTYTAIENIITGVYNDTIYGSNDANYIESGRGNDTVTDGFGADTVVAGDGNDIVRAVAGDDDTFAGGLGTDQIDYSLLSNETGEGVIFMMTWTENAGNIDTISGFEKFVGSQYNDIFVGAAGAQLFAGGAGDDLFRSFGGLDQLYLGAGFDYVSFNKADVVSDAGIHLGYDTIFGFNKDEDTIDLVDIFADRTITDPTAMIRLAVVGNSTALQADFGNGVFKNVALLSGVTGLNVASLITNGAVLIEDVMI